MPIQSIQGPLREVAGKEKQLLASGYREVTPAAGASPQPGEYTKTSFTGSNTSFEGEQQWILTWRI